MTWVTNENRLGQPIIGEAADTARIALGTIMKANDPTYGAGEFIFLSGVANTEAGSWVTYNADDFSTTLLGQNPVGPVAVAMGATIANTFGWYQIQGKAVGKALTGYVDDADVYATTTAGSVDDTVRAGDRIKRARGASAVGTPSAGLAEFEIERPFGDDGKAA